jgi:Xaa-Pro dipeptidase
MFRNPFDEEEILGRIAALRSRLQADELEAAVVASPENVFYLTGLDHWGYFAPHLLIVPLSGTPVLVTRAMERVSIEKQVTTALFRGHSDAETAADVASKVLSELGLRNKQIGLESWTSGLSHGLGRALQESTEARWVDVSGMVDQQRLVKSAAEQKFLRQAAEISEAAARAAIAVINDGAQEADVAAECLAAMVRAGGHPPGFGPFIRPQSRLGEEHATWGDGRFRTGEAVFLELSGCISRYHAPLGRIIRIGGTGEKDRHMASVAQNAFDAVIRTLRPGKRAKDVYGAWQQVVKEAGLNHYRRHHCGYCVGIGAPPSWTGGNNVVGLRSDSDLVIRSGMSFHVLSWLMNTGRGDHFLSNTVLVTESGTEVLTRSLPNLLEIVPAAAG